MSEVIMPKMGDAMTEGKIIAWRKNEGDAVKRGEAIAEIETEKVNVEIEAEGSGTLTQIVTPAGEVAAVGSVIAYINGGGGRATAAAAPGPTPAASQATPPQKSAAPQSPTARQAAAAPETKIADERIKASPLARRLAAERGVDLTNIQGTGPGGRIVERDVEEASARGSAAPAAAAPAAPTPAAAPTAQPSAAPRTGPDFSDVTLSRMRQAIARSVVSSKREQPHFYVTSEADMSRALQFRDDLRAAYGDSDGKVSVNDLIVKATALALRKLPALNAQIVDDKTLRQFHRVHIGVMVAIPDGLIVPVLRDADTLPLLQLARETRRLIEGARKGQLRQDEFAGATFSISNLGMYDVTHFVAILGHPQAGILAVGRAQDRAVVRDGQIVARPILELTVSADHRVTDGVGTAGLLVEVKRLLENPLLLLT